MDLGCCRRSPFTRPGRQAQAWRLRSCALDAVIPSLLEWIPRLRFAPRGMTGLWSGWIPRLRIAPRGMTVTGLRAE
jgi:hypothetical protein